MSNLTILVLISTALYVAACAWWPFTKCGRCKGTGKRRSPSGKAWRTCRGCDGSGKHVRLDRRVYEALRGDDRDGAPHRGSSNGPASGNTASALHDHEPCRLPMVGAPSRPISTSHPTT
jgi:hypothetical protein